MKNKISYFIWFIIYFFIHYRIDTLPNIGGVSVAQLWKIPLLLYMLGYCIFKRNNHTTFETIGFILFAEYMLSPETMVNTLNSVSHTIKALTIMFLYGFLDSAYRKRPESLQNWLFALAQFIPILSFPFLIGVLQPIKEYGSAEYYFGVKGLVYYTASLGSGHCAASYFCASILTLLHGFKINRFKTKWSKIFNILLIIISLISIYKAYVRTGWLMLIVGIITTYSYRRITVKRLRNATLVLTTVFIGIIVLFNTSDAFHARMVGTNLHTGNSADKEKLDTGGSGRTKFWKNAIIGLYEHDNIYYSLFGQGMTMVKKLNKETTGMEVFSHNQFLDALSQNGILGFILLCLFYWYIYKHIKRNNSPHQKLCYALYFSSLIFAFFQNEMYFDYAVIFALALSLNHITAISHNNPIR